MKTKRLLSFILTVCMVAGLFSGVTFAASPASVENLTVVYDVEGFVKTQFKGEYGDDFNKITYENTKGAFRYVSSSDADGVSDAAILRARAAGTVQIGSGKFLSLEVYIPASGTYTMKMYNGLRKSSGGTAEVFLAKNSSTSDSDKIGNYNSTGTDSASDWMPIVTPNTIENITVSEPGYYVLTFKAIGGYATVGKFELVLGNGEGKATMAPILSGSGKKLKEGKSETISAVVYNSLGEKIQAPELTFTSLTPETASVSANGEVTAIAPGEIRIEVTATYEGTSAKSIYENRAESDNASGYTAIFDFKRDFAYKTPVADISYETTQNFWGFVAQNGDKTLQIHNGYGIQHLSTGTAHWVAVKINVPAKGEYDVTLTHGTRDSGSLGEVYVLPQITAQTKEAIAEALLSATAIGEVNYEGAENNSVDTVLGTANFAEGDNIIVFKPKAKGAKNCYMFPGKLTLSGGEKVALMDVSLVCENGKASVSGVMSDESAADLSNAGITYRSSDITVATISQKGFISENKIGETVISATIIIDGRTFERSVDYSVTKEPVGYSGVDLSYDFSSWKGTWTEELGNAAGYNDKPFGSPIRDARGITYEHTPGNWEWRGVGDASGWNNWKTTADSTFRLYNGTATYARLTKDNQYIAYNIKVPAAGKYSAEIEHLVRSTDAKNIDIFILPGSTANEEIYSKLTDENLLGNVSFYTDGANSTTKTTLNNIVIDEAGEHILVFKQSGITSNDTYFRFVKISLFGLNCVRETEVKIEKNDLLYGETAKIDVTAIRLDGTTMAEGDYEVSYNSSFSDVATVSDEGIVTATGDGETVITVSVSDGKNTVVSELSIKATDNTTPLTTELVAFPTIFVRGSEKLDWRVRMESGNVLKVPFDTVSYSYSEEGIVSADGYGRVTGLSEGVVEVTLSADFRGKAISDSVTFTVKEGEGKSEPTYYTYEKRATAKENIKKYSWAKADRDSAVKSSDNWVANYEAIYNAMVGEGIPRAYKIGLLDDPEFELCKWCGKNVDLEGLGWSINLITRPWKIQCPYCKRQFPSNDFALLYSRGVDEKGYYNRERAIAANAEAVANGEKDALINELYPEIDSMVNVGRGLRQGETVEGWAVDDGLGYRPKDENGDNYVHSNGVTEVHAYIPCYVYKMHNKYASILGDLVRAYNYTDDIKYGRVGAILLDRYVDLFPGYNQTQYGKTWPLSDGRTGIGHIIGRIEGAGHTTNIALAADAFFPALTDSQVINFLEAKSSEMGLENKKSSALEIWDNWDKNLLTEAYEQVLCGNILGNYGLYQQTVATAAVIKDKEPETGEMLEWIYAYDNPDTADSPEGGDFTARMVDVVDRDGMGNESAPGYNGMWIGRLGGMADALAHYTGEKSYNPYENPKFVNMALAFTYLLTANNQTANIGDHVGMAYPFIECKETSFKAAFRNLPDGEEKKRLADFLYINYNGDFDGMYYSIYDENPEDFGKEVEALVGDTYPVYGSEMLTGYGFAALRGGNDYRASEATASNNLRDFWLYFGKNYGHGHHSTLNLGMEAFGLNIAPDPGEPALKGTDAIRLQWVNRSLSHNTVTVGDNGETNQEVGTPLHFDDEGKVKVMDIDSPDAYADTDIYRRTVVMVEVDDDTAYGVDFFRIKGGDRHTYSFHSQAENAYVREGLTMEEQKDADGNWEGSYADRNWPVGEDPNSPETWYYDTVYPRGYSWLGKVRRDANPGEKFAVEFDVEDYNRTIKNGNDIVLRLTQMTNFTPDEVVLTAGPTPRRSDTLNLPETMDYMLVQRKGENLDSTFTTVLEPYRGESRYIKDINLVEVTVKDGTETEDDIVRAVKVEFENGRVDYVIHATNRTVTYNIGGEFDFRGAIGVLTKNADGVVIYRYVNDGDIIGGETGAPARLTGTIADFERDLSFDNYIDINIDGVKASELCGKFIFINNSSDENGVYEIKNAEDLGNGKIRLDTGLVTLIRRHRDAKNPERGYVYNIQPNQTFEIYKSFVDASLPEFEDVGNITATAGSSISFNVKATAAAAVEYSGRTLPRGASLDKETGTITWKPSSSQVGDNHFAITATDSEGRENTIHFIVKVTGSTSGGTSGNGGTSGGSTGGSAGGSTGGGGGATPPTTTPSDEKDNDKDSTTNVGDGVLGVPSTEGKARFTDLGAHAWAEDAINALADEGIIKGTSEDTFSPANNITRADFAILLVRAFKKTSDNTENFADVEESDYFARELAVARNTGLVGGVGDNKFAPKSFITRQDMMVIVYRALSSMDKLVGADIIRPEYADFEEVADYARDAVSALLGAGLVNGKNGKIAPQDMTTRAEVAVLLKRVLDFAAEK